jgi:hypothetical protein
VAKTFFMACFERLFRPFRGQQEGDGQAVAIAAVTGQDRSMARLIEESFSFRVYGIM